MHRNISASSNSSHHSHRSISPPPSNTNHHGHVGVHAMVSDGDNEGSGPHAHLREATKPFENENQRRHRGGGKRSNMHIDRGSMDKLRSRENSNSNNNNNHRSNKRHKKPMKSSRDKPLQMKKWESPEDYVSNNKPPNMDRDYDTPDPPSDDDHHPPPGVSPPARLSRNNTPFRDIENKIIERRGSRGKRNMDDAHYSIHTKNITRGRKKSNELANISRTKPLYEDSNSDSNSEENNGRKKSKKGDGRVSKKDKTRKRSIQRVLNLKMTFGKSNDTKEPKTLKESKEEKPKALSKKDKKKKKKLSKKEKKKQKEKEKRELKKREKQKKKQKKNKNNKKPKNKKTKNKNKNDIMQNKHSLRSREKREELEKNNKNKKELKYTKREKKAKTRRSSVNDMLSRFGKKSSKSDDEGDGDGDDDAKKNNKYNNKSPQKNGHLAPTNTAALSKSNGSGRKKRSQKIRRRSAGEALKDAADLNRSQSERSPVPPTKDELGNIGTLSKSKSLHPNSAYETPNKKDGKNDGRKKRKDKTRRRSYNDMFKFGKNKNKNKDDDDDDDAKEKEKEKQKEKEKKEIENNKKSSSANNLKGNKTNQRNAIRPKRKRKPRRSSLQSGLSGKKKSKSNSDSSDDESDSDSDPKSKRKPQKPSGINIGNKSNNNNKKKNSGRMRADEFSNMKKKIASKTQQKKAMHKRRETPKYDIQTKNLLQKEWQSANLMSDGEDESDDDTVASGALSEDNDDYYGAVSSPPTNAKTPIKYRTRKGIRMDRNKLKKNGGNDRDKNKYGSDDSSDSSDESEDSEDSNSNSESADKKRRQRGNNKTQKANKKRRVPLNDIDEDDGADSLTEESTETDDGSGDTDDDSESTEDSSDYTSGDTSSGSTSESDSDDYSTGNGSSDSDRQLKQFRKQMKDGMYTPDQDIDEDYDWDNNKKIENNNNKNLSVKNKQKTKEREKKEAEMKKRQQEKKRKQIELAEKNKERERKKKEEEEKRKEEERKENERKRMEIYERENGNGNGDGDDDEYEDEYDSAESADLDDYDEEDDLEDNYDDLDPEIAAYVQLNSNDTSALLEGNEHDEWVKKQAYERMHRRKSTDWRYSHKDLINAENDDSVADEKELNNIWMKLQKIPKSKKKDSTEQRIIREFMSFSMQCKNDDILSEYIVIHSIAYPNIYEWNGCFIGAKGTPYCNGRYLIRIQFAKDYPAKQPQIVFLTKIYNSSVKHNKRKRRGLLRLPKYFEKMWSSKISIRSYLNRVYEFLFFYCGDHYFDPMNSRVAREFIFAFDSFIDTCYQWNLLFADGYDPNQDMVPLLDEYGERQKLTFHCAKYANQYSFLQYKQLTNEIIWPCIRDKYKATYAVFQVLLKYFGNENYYCGLSQIIRDPHVCVKHKVTVFDNIVRW